MNKELIKKYLDEILKELDKCDVPEDSPPHSKEEFLKSNGFKNGFEVGLKIAKQIIKSYM